MAGNITVYLKTEQNVEVMESHVRVKDIASVYCKEKAVSDKIKAITVLKFRETERKRRVVSVLKVIELIEREIPGVKVENIGENATLIELVNAEKHGGIMQWLKLLFVAGISFFGTGFTIMAFHNDIDINDIFAQFYEQIMGAPASGYTIMELSYSVGLAVGIIVFFNHIGGRRITKDPTPIEVEMKIYESDVNKALIETADREGQTIDVS